MKRSEIRERSKSLNANPGLRSASSGLPRFTKLGRASVARTKDFAFAQEGGEENDTGALCGAVSRREGAARAPLLQRLQVLARVPVQALPPGKSVLRRSARLPQTQAERGLAPNPVARPAASAGLDVGERRPARTRGARVPAERISSGATPGGSVEGLVRRVTRKRRITPTRLCVAGE
jgi:hypothetical protein